MTRQLQMHPDRLFPADPDIRNITWRLYDAVAGLPIISPHGCTDPDLLETIDTLMRDEAATSFTSAAGQDLAAYANALIVRFKNPALNHRLAQIAMDGSQKISQRWLETLAYLQSEARQCPAILTALAGWLTHVRAGVHIEDDPMADQFAEIARQTDPDGFIDAFFTGSGYFAKHWQPTADDRAFLLTRVRGRP